MSIDHRGQSGVLSGRPLAVRAGLATALSVILNALLVVGSDAVAIAPGFRALTLPPVTFLSAVGALGATTVYWLVGRVADQPARTFRRIAAGGLLVSFLPDIALLILDPVATVPGVVILMLMHVIVAAVSVEFLLAEHGGIRG